MTGPVTNPPPGGPGREPDDDSDLYLASVGGEVVDALVGSLDAMAEVLAAAAPPLNQAQRALIAHLFAGQIVPPQSHMSAA
jgi:hypothetical protein